MAIGSRGHEDVGIGRIETHGHSGSADDEGAATVGRQCLTGCPGVDAAAHDRAPAGAGTTGGSRDGRLGAPVAVGIADRQDGLLDETGRGRRRRG